MLNDKSLQRPERKGEAIRCHSTAPTSTLKLQVHSQAVMTFSDASSKQLRGRHAAVTL